MKEIPETLRGDSGWKAALVILESPMFARHKGAWSFVHPEKHEIDFEGMLRAGWSHGEALLLEAAWSLFSNGCKVSLEDLATVLDSDNLEILTAAMYARAGPMPNHVSRRPTSSGRTPRGVIEGELAAKISRIWSFLDAELADMSDAELAHVREVLKAHRLAGRLRIGHGEF